METPVLEQPSNVLEAIFDPNNKMAGMASSIPDYEVKNIPGLAEYKAQLAKGPVDENEEEGEEEVEEENAPAPKAAPKKVTKKGKSDSIFFSENQTDDVPDFKEGDDIVAYMKQMGVENPKQFFTEYKGIQAKAAEADKYAGTTKEFQNWFQTIPQEIFDVLQTYNSNGDWKGLMSSMASQKIDFSRDFSQQNAFDVVSHYFPEITQEDFDNADENPSVMKAIQMSKNLYTKDQESISQEREYSQQEIQQKTEKVRASISTSLASLTKNYPGFSKEAIKNVSKMMATGEYRDMFFNEDGTFTEQAAIKLAMAQYGEQELKKAMSRGQKQGASEQNKILARRSDTQPDINSGNPGKKSSPVDARTLQFLNDLQPKKDIYSARVAS